MKPKVHFFLFLLLLSTFAEAKAKLHFRGDIKDFSQAQVKLSDVADCRGDVNLCKKMKDLLLGDAPPPGLNRIYSAQYLLMGVLAPYREQIEVDENVVQSTLWRHVVKIDTSALNKLIQDQAKKKLGSSADSLKITLSYQTIPNLSAASREWNLEWPTQMESMNRLPLKVEVVDENSLKRAFVVYLKVQKWDPTPILMLDKKLGERLNPADVQIMWRERPYYNQEKISLAELSEKWEMTRSVRAGQPLYRSMVRKPRSVKTGEQILLVSILGRGRIEMQGEALQDGSENQKIRVRNPNSGKILMVTLNAQGEGVVQP